MINIEKLNIEDSESVSGLHMRYYKSNFQNLPGKKILECYYKGVAHEIGSTGYVAKIDQKVAGYICGVWDKSLLNKFLIRKFGFQLMWWGMFQVVTHPASVVHLMDKTMRGNELIEKSGYELRPIIVDEAYQGKGIANLLVDRLVADAYERGYNSMFLITEKENIRAQKFYTKMNFDFQQDFESKTQSYRLYEMDITPQYSYQFEVEASENVR